ncbi:dihydroorotase [Puerhibacterium puerhi]|uniref:dihydroorotase n=1 Tax=Puerhibacterium puerhi TaxID=2692623 RepID=UPI0013591DA6|nr:dihydroorotase [Puerhibacterium puerhi]
MTTSSTTYVLRGARPLGAEPVDVVLADGVVAALGADVEVPGGAVEVDAAGHVLLPGLVDLHTHLREPGREDAETVASGTRAAAAGGYTAVHAMANTSPVADTAGVVEQVWNLGRQAGWVDVHPVGAVTVGLAGERLAELGAMADSAARVRVFSDDGRCVHDPVLMRRALEYVKAFDGVVAQHAQEPRLTEGAQMNEGVVSAEIGLTGWPAVAEEAIIARDVLLAEHVGSRLHVCHVSTAGSVEIIRWAKARGIAVTAEVTPHHLVLTDELARGYDPVFKVNPPLRTAADVEAVRAGLADGTIDVVATDHAPHTREDKDCEWGAAAMGMTGLETALSVVQLAMVDTGLMTWADVARVMSTAPAAIGRVADTQGRPVAVGEPANLVLVDPRATRVVDGAAQATAAANTPFQGRELPGRVVATFLRGRATVLDGAPVEPAGAVAAPGVAR